MESISKSFARRQSIYICGIVAVLFLLAAGLAIQQSVTQSSEEAEKNATAQLDIITLRIENIMASASYAVDNVAFEAIEELSREKPDTERLFNITRQLVERNEAIVGSILALPEYSLNGEKFFAAYSFMDFETGDVSTSQVGNEDYYYFAMDWYLVPKLLDKPYWGDPYFDEGAGNISMCTYSRPLKDRDGKFIGVLTADLPIEWLSEVVNEIKPYKSSYNLMVGKDASYIVHTDPERILRETIFTATYNMEDTTVFHIGREMVSGRRGSQLLENDDTTSLVFYTPVPSSGWSVAMVCPLRDVYRETKRMGYTLAIILFIIQLLLFVIINYVIGKMTEPLKSFSESARKIAEGDFNAPLPEIESEDEMRMLKDSFHHMQVSLTDYIDRLTETTSAKERIESELNIAREIQMSMIPKIFPPYPDRNDIDIYASMRPAKEVGGDLYDFFLDDGKMYFAVGDVSGKGVPASLFMAVTRSIFRSIATSAGDPGAIISAMNNAMCDGNDANMFVTLFVGIVDLNTLEMTYSNAGHNPPVIMGRDGSVAFLDVSACSGLPVGLFEDQEYLDGSLLLSSGDRLVLYTDGLTEAENRKADLYGDDRLLKTLAKPGFAQMGVRDLLESIIADVEGHVAGAPQSDDLTVMVMEFRGNSEASQKVDDESSLSTDYRRIVLHNEISQLAPMAAWIEETCAEFGASPSLTMSINLALEEAVTNVIMYAYPDNGVSATFFVDFDYARDGVATWRIVDTGKPFDPTAKEDADLTLDVMDRPIGGLGIFMVKEIMDEVSYVREDGQNILIMKINLNK